MAYRLKAGESVPENVRRVVLEEITSAADFLTKTQTANRDKAVHEARKSIKKIRGLLRLMQPELGPAFRAENKKFRDIGRQLSQIRDAAARLEVFDHLLQTHKQALAGSHFAALRRGLKREKGQVEQQLDVDKVVQRASATLHAAGSRLKSWPLHRDGFKAIAPGLRSVYRAGRKALKKAEHASDPAKFHDLRKRVKDHWYHVRLLENLWTEVMQGHESSLKELETWLGDDHNLVVLREKLEAHPEAFGSPDEIKVFLSIAAQYQKELRENSLSLGQRIYARKPKTFVAEIAELWTAWQHQPDTLKEIEKVNQNSKPTPKPVSTAVSGKSKKTAA